jgi:hypothetical protein
VDDPEVLGAVHGLCQNFHRRLSQTSLRFCSRIRHCCEFAFIALWAVAALLVNAFQRMPVQYYYDKTLKGHCMKGQVKFFQAMGSIALGEDVIILCQPIPIVWRLQMVFRQKLTVSPVFSLGALYALRDSRYSIDGLLTDSLQCLHLQSYALDRVSELRTRRPCL